MKRAAWLTILIGLVCTVGWWTSRQTQGPAAPPKSSWLAPWVANAKQQAPPSPPPIPDQPGSNPTSTAPSSLSAGLPPLTPDSPDPEREPAFTAFLQWAIIYAAATDLAQRDQLLPEGYKLAQQRRDDLEDLIQADPRRALELALPYAVRQELPAALEPYLEQRLDQRGDLEVLAALPEPGQEREMPAPWVFRTARIGDDQYRAFVYGRRLGEPTRQQIPLHGLALDNLVALSEDALRVLDPGEIPAAHANAGPGPVTCAYCSRDCPVLEPTTLHLLTGEKPLAACGLPHAALLNQNLVTTENADGFGDDNSRSVQAASAWTEGDKTMILIRVDFSDLEGEPFTDATGINLISNVNLFYRECSYNKTGFQLYGEGSDLTPTFRMSQTAAYYGTNEFHAKLRSDARAAARAAGYDLSQFNFDLICFKNVPGWNWAGLGYIGAAGVWLRNSFGTGVAAHELGHNFGLNHANFWDTGGDSVVGPGTGVEYGDKFDTMGSAGAGSKHFNARFKNYLGWLPGSRVVTVATNGLYELSAHDLTNTAGPLALKIARNSRTNYWIEFRQKYTSNKWLMNGLGLRWAQSGGQSTLLLDTTPGSVDGKDDAAIVWGQTFADPVASLFVTAWEPVGSNPQAARLYVHRGPFPDNLPPVLQVVPSLTRATVNQSVTLTAQATDPNEDPLAYAWDFGDRSVGANERVATHQWSVAGQYLVRCVASDMKGGQASVSLVVDVGTPSTFVLAGRIIAEGRPLPNARISASATLSSVTDSDGSYRLAGIAAGHYSLQAKLAGYSFIHPGFTNPLAVNRSLSNLDFIGIPVATQETLSLVTAGSIWRYLDDGSDPQTAWRHLDFDDRSWRAGPAQLGYGDLDVTTVIGYGADSRNKHITTYFRHAFAVTNRSGLGTLTLGALRDDGVVVYLNGIEVFRSNMPQGAIGSRTLAANVVGGADESAFFETELDPSQLLIGTNILAAEIHQANVTSSDLGFDLRLTASRTSPALNPRLYWEIQSSQLALFWPAALSGWNLVSTPALTPNAHWSPVSDGLVESNGLKLLRLPPGQPADGFYQLRQDPD